MDLKKILKPKMIILVVLAIIFVVLTIFFRKQLYAFFYPGNMIQGKVSVTRDGEIVKLTENDVSFDESDPMSKGMKVEVNSDGTLNVSVLGEKQGSYSFYVKGIPGTDVPVRVTISKRSWWLIVNYDLVMNVETNHSRLNYSMTYKTSDSQGNFGRIQVLQSPELYVDYNA